MRGCTDAVRNPSAVVSSTKEFRTFEYVSAAPVLDTKKAVDVGVGLAWSRQIA
jgi:hypothetical protein